MFPRADQQLSRTQRKNGRDSTIIRVLRTNLAKGSSIECQHALRGAHDDQLLVVRIGEQSSGHPQQRTGRQLLARAIVLEQLAALVVFQEPGRPADIQMALKYGSS